MSKVLLVSFAGYPYTPSSLMPDNGLASLAGSLLEAGHDARILDYGAVATVRRLFPEALSRRVRPLAEKLFVEHRRLSWLEKLRFLRAGAQLERHQEKEIRAIAAEAADEAVRFGADYVGLKLWNGDGFSGSVRIAEAIRARAPRVRPHRRRPACRLLRRAYPPIHRCVRPVDPGRGRASPSGIDRRAGAQGRLAEDPGRGVEAREPDFLQPDLRGRGARRAAASGL